MTTPLRRTLVLGAVVLPIAAAGLSVALPATASSRHDLTGTKPAWATSHNLVATANAATRGATSANTVSGQVWLQFNHPDQVQALLAQATSANTKARGKYLTAAQFNARFSPTAVQISKVTGWLTGAGLRASVASDHRSVAFSGAATKVAKAFGTTFASYKYHGKVYRAPTSNASVPNTVASAVLTVTGLDNFTGKIKPRVQAPTPPPSGFRNGPVCSKYYRQQIANYTADGNPLPTFRDQHPSYAQCGFTPAQLRGAYGLGTTSSSQNGAGITVAITDAYRAGTIVEDTNQYFDNHYPAAGHIVTGRNYFQTLASNNTNEDLCNPTGWAGEETLDVQAVHAMAPGAKIHYYGAASCLDSDLLKTLQQAVNDDVDVITNSWGDIIENESAATIKAYQQVFTQAAMQGITVLFSSGDDGDAAMDTASGKPDSGYPDSDPLVTAAGGTSTGISQGNNIAFQSGWGTVKWSLSSPTSGSPSWNLVGFIYGSGGGVSPFAKPSWQSGFGTSANRTVPDIAADGDPNTGMLIGETQDFGDIGGGVEYGEFRIGGTSLSSPLLAGMIAVVDQKAHAAGNQNIGFANPAIYQLAGTSAVTDVLPHGGAYVRDDYINGVNNNDGITYSVRTVNQDTSLKTTTGYDYVTGVGVPNSSFYAALAAKAPSA
jgi:subtilase family serine protease